MSLCHCSFWKRKEEGGLGERRILINQLLIISATLSPWLCFGVAYIVPSIIHINPPVNTANVPRLHGTERDHSGAITVGQS